MKEILKKEGITEVDVIISGIPFANFSKADADQMLGVISGMMHKDSRFVLFTYVKSKLKTFFSRFDKVSVDYVAVNIPPAYVLTLRKKS
jgi:phospholipid N-methyltransferase